MKEKEKEKEGGLRERDMGLRIGGVWLVVLYWPCLVSEEGKLKERMCSFF